MLLAVVGSISLVISALTGLSSLTRLAHEQPRFLRMAIVYLAASVVIFLLRYFFFVLPDKIRRSKSGTVQRRLAYYRNVKRPDVSHSEQEGSVLVFALILLGVLSTVAVNTLVSSRAHQREAAAMTQHVLLKSAALDTARAAMQQLADDDPVIDHLGESWANASEEQDPAGVTRRLRILDLQSEFDLNNLVVPAPGSTWPPSEILASIMAACGTFTPGSAVEALRDWVDANDDGTYEKKHYEDRAPAALIANRPLYADGELLEVERWNDDMFEKKLTGGRAMFDGNLSDAVTIIPAERTRAIPLNINTANKDALIGLFGVGGESMVERILMRRKAGPIANLDFIARQIEPALFERVSAYIDIRSQYFMIDAAAYRDGRSARIELIARRNDEGRVDVLRAVLL